MELRNSDNQFDIENRSKFLKSMILAIMPIAFVVGLIGVPYFNNVEPYWANPTVIPASSFLFFSAVSYFLVLRGRYEWAVNIYVYIFLLAPFIASVRDDYVNVGLFGLMVGGVIVGSVMFRSRKALIISAVILNISILLSFFIAPSSQYGNLFITYSVSATLSALVVIFKIINEVFEKRRRERLEEINEKLRRQNEELEKINRELDQFIYSVSHDLRAPLTSIMGLLNLYKADSNPVERDQYIKHINTSTRKLEEYIYEIEDFAKNSKTKLIPSRINIEEYLNSIYSQLSYIDPHSNITFEVYCDGVQEIITDQLRLGIILRNILANSVKFARKANGPYIRCEVEQQDSKHIFKVKDNGIGIDKEHLDRVFDMFHRATEKSSGAGLGLYIAKETAERLGGNIDISSKINEGTQVIIELPKIYI